MRYDHLIMPLPKTIDAAPGGKIHPGTASQLPDAVF